MKLSSGLLLITAVVVSFAVAVVTFVAVDRFMEPEIVVQPPEAKDISVAITGGVATPGVVTVPVSSRLQNVVDAAGGLSPDADVSSLNMAGRVGDGERVVIPVIDGNASLSAPTAERDAADIALDASPSEADAPLDLNTASIPELEALPGIGPVLAGRIIAYRTANGPFSSVDELMEVEGISTDTLEELLPFVTVDG